MADFRAYAEQDGTDYTLVVSLPLNTTINPKNRVSVSVEDNNFPNLPITTRDSDTLLTGGRVGDITITQTQFDAIIPEATATVAGTSYFIADQVDLYNTRFFPRVASTTYYGYLIPDGNNYEFYFSLPSTIQETAVVSLRFETAASTFTSLNGVQMTVVESSTEGLDDYFTQDGNIGMVPVTAAQFAEISGLFTLEAEVGIRFLTDTNTVELFDFDAVPENAAVAPTEGIDVAPGDKLFFLRNSGTIADPILANEVQFAGVVTLVESTRVFYTTEPTSDVASSDDFFLVGKDTVVETSGVIGFFSKVKFISDDTGRAELFAVNSEAVISSQ